MKLSDLCSPRCLAVGAVLATLPSAQLALADSFSVNPGLWEHTMSMESETGQLERAMEEVRRQMEAMPEAQRQMMEDMLEQQGMSLDFANQTVQDCVSEEEAEVGDFDWSEEDDCEQTSIDQRGSETRVEFVCEEDNAKGEMVFRDGTEYSGESQMTVDFEGQEELVTVTHEGRWLGEDCGDLRPD